MADMSRHATRETIVDRMMHHHYHQEQQQHQHGYNMNSRTRMEKDEDLALFQDMRKGERTHYLHPDTEDAKLGGLSDSITAAQIQRKGVGADLLNSDVNKNDYDWLLTPPGTPLFPSLDLDSPAYSALQQGLLMNRSLAAIKTSWMASNNPADPASSKLVRVSNPSPTRRPSTPQNGHRNLAQGTPTSSGSHSVRLSTPTRSALTSASKYPRPSTPTRQSAPTGGRPSTTALNRPSTPTGRPSTPTLHRSSSSSITQPVSTRVTNRGNNPSPTRSTASSGTSRGISPARSQYQGSSPARGSSPAPSMRRPSSPRAHQIIIPDGLSSEIPPNLRTTSDRPSSAHRRHAGYVGTGQLPDGLDHPPSHKPSSPNFIRSCSSTSHGQDHLSVQSGRVSSDDDSSYEASSQSAASGRGFTPERGGPVYGHQSSVGNEDWTNNRPNLQTRRSPSRRDSPCVGPSRKTPDSAAHNLDIQRASSGGFRPLTTKNSISTFYSTRANSLLRNRPLTPGSTASSEQGASVAPDSEADEDLLHSGWGHLELPLRGGHTDVLVLDAEDEKLKSWDSLQNNHDLKLPRSTKIHSETHEADSYETLRPTEALVEESSPYSISSSSLRESKTRSNHSEGHSECPGAAENLNHVKGKLLLLSTPDAAPPSLRQTPEQYKKLEEIGSNTDTAEKLCVCCNHTEHPGLREIQREPWSSMQQEKEESQRGVSIQEMKNVVTATAHYPQSKSPKKKEPCLGLRESFCVVAQMPEKKDLLRLEPIVLSGDGCLDLPQLKDSMSNHHNSRQCLQELKPGSSSAISRKSNSKAGSFPSLFPSQECGTTIDNSLGKNQKVKDGTTLQGVVVATGAMADVLKQDDSDASSSSEELLEHGIDSSEAPLQPLMAKAPKEELVVPSDSRVLGMEATRKTLKFDKNFTSEILKEPVVECVGAKAFDHGLNEVVSYDAQIIGTEEANMSIPCVEKKPISSYSKAAFEYSGLLVKTMGKLQVTLLKSESSKSSASFLASSLDVSRTPDTISSCPSNSSWEDPQYSLSSSFGDPKSSPTRVYDIQELPSFTMQAHKQGASIKQGREIMKSSSGNFDLPATLMKHGSISTGSPDGESLAKMIPSEEKSCLDYFVAGDLESKTSTGLQLTTKNLNILKDPKTKKAVDSLIKTDSKSNIARKSSKMAPNLETLDGEDSRRLSLSTPESEKSVDGVLQLPEVKKVTLPNVALSPVKEEIIENTESPGPNARKHLSSFKFGRKRTSTPEPPERKPIIVNTNVDVLNEQLKQASLPGRLPGKFQTPVAKAVVAAAPNSSEHSKLNSARPGSPMQVAVQSGEYDSLPAQVLHTSTNRQIAEELNGQSRFSITVRPSSVLEHFEREHSSLEEVSYSGGSSKDTDTASLVSRNITLAEATDRILFCSSIVHDLVYEAAELASAKERNNSVTVVSPHLEVFLKAGIQMEPEKYEHSNQNGHALQGGEIPKAGYIDNNIVRRSLTYHLPSEGLENPGRKKKLPMQSPKAQVMCNLDEEPPQVTVKEDVIMHPAETVRLKREVDSNANKVNEKCCCVIL
ncbi:unnamed protein product [Sphagnum troendelagicum]|uniref:Uncharacterized protein n=1 Tax=Sphagnum troendelagicum TaxID=128251 RepID=A0ABP0TA43_9BRYO